MDAKAHRNNGILEVKSLYIRAGQVRSTVSALTGATVLGLDFQDMVEVVIRLESSDFYKSMTTQHDHRVWQDVYRPKIDVGEIYLKLTVIDEVLIVSVKEL